MKYQQQDGVIVGNIEKKDKLSNPIARKLVEGFDSALFKLIDQAAPRSVHEIGCGEGRLLEQIVDRYHISARGTDIGQALITQNKERGNGRITYEARSVYDLEPEDRADLIVCCEVLEHVDRPALALEKIAQLQARNFIFSVPREPIWRLMNLARGKYISDLGNTPGHLNHWSRRGFRELLVQYGFEIKAVFSPLPWTLTLCCLDSQETQASAK